MFNRNRSLGTGKKQINWFKVIGTILLIQLSWIVLFMLGEEEAELSWYLQNNGVTTSGTVVKIHHGAKMSTWPEVTFEANNKTYILEFKRTMRKFKVGEQVMVLYDPSDPNIAQIDNDARWKFPVMMICSAILFASFFNSLVIWGLLERWRQARLLSQSYRLPPIV